MRRVTVIYECRAPDELFGEWDDVPQESRDKIGGGLPCDGGGVPGAWCSKGCFWESSVRHDLCEDGERTE